MVIQMGGKTGFLKTPVASMLLPDLDMLWLTEKMHEKTL
jgi:hypothetical protein